MKKTLVLLLALLLCLLISFASAEESEAAEREILESGDYSYALLEDGTGEIVEYRGEAEELTIPDALDGHAVTAIGKSAFSGVSLTSVIIPDSVTAIGDSVFANNEKLTDITIPDSVTDIGANPFRSCYSLKQITVSPDNPSLTTIDGVLFSKPDKRLVTYPCAFTQPEYTIPDGIEIIGNNAFWNSSSLTSITIPDSVTDIGSRAFAACDSLTAIIIPDSVTAIGKKAFSSCSNLTQITIPDSVTAIGDDAFEKCSSLTAIIVGRDSCAIQYCIDNDLPYTFAAETTG